jgi:topoisomerase-4 subunit A
MPAKKKSKRTEKVDPQAELALDGPPPNSDAHVEAETEVELEHPAEVTHKGPLHRRIDHSFLEYASYVIRDRAIPNIADGLKPVQRRIMWALHEKDSGKFIKVANIVGHAMQYHPHGDASIADALVNLVNKRYLIEGQGNFGNIYTGDPAAASRYIECRLTELARNEVFNDEITDFVPSYDGTNKEPVTLPSKLPLLLMLGTEGIAVGMSSRILPHNFFELIEAQIAILEKKPFKVLPDFFTGGLMDARDYQDGQGFIKVRARIKIKDDSTIIINELPPHTTTESLLASIEDASKKGKLKVKAINDFTAEKVEIEIKTPAGVEAEKLVSALYAFTACESKIDSRIVLIKDNRPVEMTVSEILRENTDQLVAILKKELELKLSKLEADLHFRTLERIFIEERIYKKIEKCKTNEAVFKAVYDGFVPFKKELVRALTDEDVTRLLAVRIRRISLFDINKHREEIEHVKKEIAETNRHLKRLVKYAINHLEMLLAKYGSLYPRLTKKARFDEVEAKQAAFKAFKISYDLEKGYIGHKVSGEEFKIDCTKFDKFLMVFKDGTYKVTELPEKLFVGPGLIYCAIPDKNQVFTVAYATRDASYLKRIQFGGFIMNKEYELAPKKAKVLFFEEGTPDTLYIRYKPAPHQKINQQTCQPKQLEVKGARVKGRQISIKSVANITSKPTRGWDEEATTTKLQFT